MSTMTADISGQVIDATQLVNKTVFIAVSFGVVGNSRTVKQDIIDNTENKLVDGEAKTVEVFEKSRCKTSKTLLESEELKAVKKGDQGIKIALQAMCLPAPSKGLVMVPYGNIGAVVALLKEYRDVTRPALVSEFKKAYPFLKGAAKSQLGPLYNELDYPTLEDVSDCFSFTFNFVNFGAPGHLKTFSPEMFAEANKAAEGIMIEAAEEARQATRALFLGMVSELKDVLTPEIATDGSVKHKSLHKSRIEKLQAAIDGFKTMDVTNDTEMQGIVLSLRSAVAGVNTEQLKSSDNFRDAVIAELADVQGKLAPLVEFKAGRVYKNKD